MATVIAVVSTCVALGLGWLLRRDIIKDRKNVRV